MFEEPSGPSGLSTSWRVRAACFTETKFIKSTCQSSIVKQLGVRCFPFNRIIHLADRKVDAMMLAQCWVASCSFSHLTYKLLGKV